MYIGRPCSFAPIRVLVLVHLPCYHGLFTCICSVRPLIWIATTSSLVSACSGAWSMLLISSLQFVHCRGGWHTCCSQSYPVWLSLFCKVWVCDNRSLGKRARCYLKCHLGVDLTVATLWRTSRRELRELWMHVELFRPPLP